MEKPLRRAARSIPRARLVEKAEDWRWSSVRAHLAGMDDALVSVAPGIERVGDFRAFLDADFDEATDFMALRKAESVGRPIGDSEWLTALEAKTGRVLAAQKRGPVARGVDKSA